MNRLLQVYDFFQTVQFEIRRRIGQPEEQITSGRIRQIESALLGIVPSYSTPDPRYMFGLDVAHWDGVVDWEKAKAAGVKFAIIKGKDGTTTSQFFKENYAGAKAAGIPRGVYGWLYPSDKVSAGTQARSMYELLKDDLPELGVFIDYEWTYWNGKPANPDQSDLYGYVIPSEEAFGYKPVIYSAPGYVNQFTLPDPMWKNYFFWVAHYKVLTPDLPLPWRNLPEPRWIFWQFAEDVDALQYGGDPLIVHAFDGDYFYGSQADLDLFIQSRTVSTPPPPPPPTGESMFKVTSNSTVNKRDNGDDIIIAGAPPSGTDIGDFASTDIGYGNEVKGSPTGAYYCLRVTEYNGQSSDFWIYARHNNLPTHATITQIAEPPPPPPPPATELPVIDINLTLKAAGYPDKVITDTWTPQ